MKRLLLLFALAAQGCAAAPPGPCGGAPYSLAAPLVGVWEEYSVEGDVETLGGQLASEFVAGGCAFEQRFVSADDQFSFQSFGYVDPEDGLWRERFVLSDGRTAEYRWRPNGADILLEREDNPGYRLRITGITEREYRVYEETSADTSANWQTVSVTVTRRIQ